MTRRTFSIFGGVYYWFPKITGRMYNERWGKIGFWLTFVGVNIVFWIMMTVGVKGMPRRYYDYSHFPQFQTSHQLMTLGAAILGIISTAGWWRRRAAVATSD